MIRRFHRLARVWLGSLTFGPSCAGFLNSGRVLLCLAASISLFGGSLSGATTRTWDGGANDGLWSSQKNWSANTPPAGTDNATFASGFGSGGTSLSLNGNQTIVNLTFSTTTSFSINNDTLTINGTTSAINRSATSGTTTINSAISLGNNQTWTVANGGTLVVAGNVADNGKALTIDSAGSTTISGVIGGGAGTLTKLGVGTLTLTGANSYTGDTTISAGIVNIQNNTALGTTAGNVSVASGAELQVQGGITVGTGEDVTSIVGTGTGTSGAIRNISGANTWNGTITLGGATTIGSDAGTLTLAGNIINGGNTLTVTGAGNTFISGVIGTGAGGLTKTGSGTLTLTGANSFTGTTTISAGIVNIQNNTGLGTTLGDVSVTSGAELQIQNGITVGTGEDVTSIAGTGTGTSGALRNISGANTWNGTITLAGATTIGSDAGTLTLAGNIINGGNTLTITGAGNTTVSGVIGNGAGGLTKSGEGTLVLTADNTYSGTTTISAGTLESQIVSGLGSGGVTLSGGTFSVTTVDQTYGNIFTVSSDSMIDVASGRSFTLGDGANDLTGAGKVTKTGTGTLSLGFSNNQSGGFDINAGTVLSTAAGALGTGNVTLAGGTLSVTTANQTYSQTFTVSSDSTIDVGAGVAFTLGNAANDLTGAGKVTKTGTGSLSLGFSNNNSGGMDVNAGTVVMSDPGSVGTGALTIASGGTVAAGFSSATAAGVSSITLNGGLISRTVDGALNSIFMSDTGNTLTSTGSSTLSDSGGAAAGYLSINGVVAVNSGTLTLNAAAAGDKVALEGTQTITIADGATLATSGSGDVQLGTGGGRTIIGLGSSSEAKIYVPTAGPTVGATLSASSSIVVNGSGLYGLRVEGKPSNVDAILSSGAIAAVSGSGGTLTVAYDSTATSYFNTQPTAGTTVKLGFDATGGSPVYNLSSAAANQLSNFGGLVVKGGTVGIIKDLKFTGNGSTPTTLDMSGGTLKLETVSASTKVWFTGAINLTGGALYGGSGGGATGWLKGEDNITVSSGVTLQNGPKLESAPISGTKVIGGSGNLNGLSEFSKTGTGDTRLDIQLSGAIQINQGSLLLGADNVIGAGSSVAMVGGTLNTMGNDNSGIGVMSLANNSYLDMAGGNIFGTDNSVISFADSSAASWNGGSTLYILNWTGIDTVGHGGSDVDQVYFGTTSGGLSPAQVGQIIFVDPWMNSEGSQYIGNLEAIILPTGEVVPWRRPVPEARTVVLTALLGCVGLLRERRRLRAGLERLFA